MGDGRSEWITLRFTDLLMIVFFFFSGHGVWVVDARGMRCPDFGTRRGTRDIQPKVRRVSRELDQWPTDFGVCRHAMLVDQKTESVVVPLNTALASQGKLELANSM